MARPPDGAASDTELACGTDGTVNAGEDLELLPDCGAVVVAHARLDLAMTCVRSLRRWLETQRIVVVLNMPNAVEGPPREELQHEARLLSPPRPQGYGANLNLGVDSLGKDVDLFLLANDDVVLSADSLPRLVDCMRRDRTVAVAGPQLVHPDGRKAASAGEFPGVADTVISGLVLPGPFWRRRERRLRIREAEAIPPGPVDFVFGAAMLVRRQAFSDVGGFDERFFLNWEEVDFCFRVHERGWRVVWCPEAEVVHAQGSSISRPLNFTTFYSGQRLYLARRLGFVRWTLLELLLAMLFAAGLVYDLVGSVVRPRTLRRRVEQTRQRWLHRVFLRRRYVAHSVGVVSPRRSGKHFVKTTGNGRRRR